MITEITTENGMRVEKRHNKTIPQLLAEMGRDDKRPSLIRIEDKLAWLSNEISEVKRHNQRLANALQEEQLKSAIIKDSLSRIVSVI